MTSHTTLEAPRHGGRVPALTADNRRWWTLGAMCFALFMLMLDNTVVNVALPTIQRSLGLSIGGLEWTVNAYTLTFAVSAGHRRAPGRHLWPAALVSHRRRDLRRIERVHRPRPELDLADRRACRTGHRRRADDAGHPVDRDQRLPPAGARQGDRHLGRGQRAGAGHRPGRGRFPGRARLLAVDLLPQRPGGDPRRHRDVVRRRGIARRERRAHRRLCRRGQHQRRARRVGPGSDRGQRLGLGLGPDPGPACARRGRAGRVHGRRAAQPRADGRLPLFREPAPSWAPTSSASS